jgi:hypothetical protein
LAYHGRSFRRRVYDEGTVKGTHRTYQNRKRNFRTRTRLHQKNEILEVPLLSVWRLSRNPRARTRPSSRHRRNNGKPHKPSRIPETTLATTDKRIEIGQRWSAYTVRPQPPGYSPCSGSPFNRFTSQEYYSTCQISIFIRIFFIEFQLQRIHDDHNSYHHNHGQASME